MRSDDLYEQAARDDDTARHRNEHEAQDERMMRDDQLDSDDQLTADDRTARDDQVTGGDWMGRDERAPGDERMSRDDRMPSGERMAGDDPTTADDDLARDGRMSGRDQTDSDAQLTRDDDELTDHDDDLARDGRITGSDQLDRDEQLTGDRTRGARPVAGDGADTPLELFGESDVNRFRDEWREIQAKFVDDPQEAVRGADHLVSEVMDSLTETFNHHKHDLEEQWQHGEDAETEGLRQALRRYRTFFDQLLNA